MLPGHLVPGGVWEGEAAELGSPCATGTRAGRHRPSLLLLQPADSVACCVLAVGQELGFTAAVVHKSASPTHPVYGTGVAGSPQGLGGLCLSQSTSQEAGCSWGLCLYLLMVPGRRPLGTKSRIHGRYKESPGTHHAVVPQVLRSPANPASSFQLS